MQLIGPSACVCIYVYVTVCRYTHVYTRTLLRSHTCGYLEPFIGVFIV